MSLIIADRVKETTVTQGTGTITLSGSTFGGFQSFDSAIGEGNTTYYCIQNESNFEIGVGTYSSGTLSRDSVVRSSNAGSKISITGAALVFCVIPADKLLYKDESGNLTTTGDLLIDDLTVDYILANSGDFIGPVSTHKLSSTDIFAENITTNGELGVSGLLTLRRESAGNFFHAYIDDLNDRTISLYSDGVGPNWSLGLKNSPSDDTSPPTYGYITAGDSTLGIIGSMDNKITMSNATPFCVTHQGVNIIAAHYATGIHLNSMSSAYPALIVNGGISLSANIQEWDTYNGTTLSVVDSDGNFGIRNDNPSYQLDVTGTGSFSQAIRFGDGTIQTTSALPFASGQLIDQNSQNIITQSGYFQSYVSQSSGVLQSQIDQNTSNTSATSGYFESRVDSLDSSVLADSGYFESRLDSTDSTLSSTSGYFESRVDSADSNNTATSGYFESRSDTTDSNVTATSGYFESRVDSSDVAINTVSGLLTPSGQSLNFAGNVLTYNNSDGGSFTADLSSLSTFDTSGVSLGYSTGTLTYTNNAGGTFDVDLSSISGDVYSMIVGGAPATLDTLNEIAAALNDDANLATTLTTLISTSSGNLQSQITSNDGDITQLNSDITTVSGLLYNDASLSGYFESRVDSTDSNVTATSGYFESRVGLADSSIAANSGYFESRVDQADSDILAVSGLIGDADFLPGSSGGLIDQNAEDIVTVSGLLDSVNPTGTPSGISFFDDSGSLSGNSSFVFDGQNATIDGYINASGQRVITSPNIHHITQVTQSEYDAITPESATFYIITDAPSVSGYFESRVDQSDSDIATVSGLLDSVNPTGTPSGISFFDDSGSLSGNNSLIYDGQDIKVSGRMFASGEQVITSDEIFHIKQLTQIEYNSITPNSATFYIITDSETEGPVVQPIKTVSSDYTILTSDYTVYTTAALTLTLPSAVGNQGVMFNIKNISTGLVTINGVGGNTIDGQSSVGISTQYQSISLQSTNSDWIIV